MQRERVATVPCHWAPHLCPATECLECPQSPDPGGRHRNQMESVQLRANRAVIVPLFIDPLTPYKHAQSHVNSHTQQFVFVLGQCLVHAAALEQVMTARHISQPWSSLTRDIRIKGLVFRIIHCGHSDVALLPQPSL